MSNGIITAKILFSEDKIKSKFHELLGERAPAFMTSVLQTVSQNALLATADPMTIFQAAAVAATLNLPINNSLGFAYIVPYNNRVKEGGNWVTKCQAQFQMGYKGFIQLAQRTGQYRTISAAPILDGQLKSQNPLTGFEFDFTQQKSDKVIGYASYFSLVNGFEKTWFLTTEQMSAHGKRYSKSFDNEKGLWKNDFDAMALKTVLKLNLSKYGPLSIDMQRAISLDQSVVRNHESGENEYVDADAEVIDKESERLTLMIQDASTLADLLVLQEHVGPEHADMYQNKLSELSK